MARSSRLAMLLALVCAGAGAVAWTALRAPRARTALVEATPAHAEETEDADAPRASTALERAEPAQDEEQEAEPAATLVAPQSRTSATAEQAELAGAIWIEGRVLFPAGTPTDERAEVVAVGHAFETLRNHRADVARDGSFRVAFHPKTEKAKLLLEARYVHLDAAFKLDLDEPPAEVVLAPKLGALIDGVLLPPEVLRPGDPMPDEVQLSLGSEGRSSISGLARRGERGHAFEIGGVPAGSAYSLVAYPEGWRELEVEIDVVAAGERRTLELQLAAGARISGRVVDEAGQGVARAKLGTRTTVHSGSQSWSSAEERMSGDGGAFDVGGVTPGAIALTAQHAGYVPARVELGELAEGEARTDVEIVLARGGSVAGRVQWPDGRPAEGALVRVEQPPSAERGFFFAGEAPSARAADDGAFEVTGLSPGPYRVSASAKRVQEPGTQEPGTQDGAQGVAQVDGVPAGTRDLVLVLGAGASVRGRVADDQGAPVGDFTIAVRRASAQPWQKPERSQDFRDAGGAFEVGGLAPGDWSVSADAEGHGRSHAVRVTLPRDSEPVELVVRKAARVAGTVLDPSGRPAAGALVTAVGLESTADHGRDHQARTEDDGAFTLAGVPPGRIALEAAQGGSAGTQTLELELRPSEQRAGVVLQLLRGGRIEGEIVVAEPARRAGQNVMIAPSGNERGAGRWRSEASDGAGRFVFDHVLPGAYRVEAPELGSGPADVTVEDGATARVVLGRPKEGAIRVFGQVTRAGAGVPGMAVMAWREGSRANAQTDAAGAYELLVDGPGAYTFTLYGRESGTGASHQEEIAAGAEQRIDFALPSGRIRGRVVAPDGGAVSGAVVSAVGQGGQGMAASGADGAFAIEGLPAGRIHVRAQAESSSYAPATREVELGEGATLDGVELRLAEGGTIEGTVTTRDGRPLVGAAILLAPGPRQWTGQTTDGAGRFKLDGLAGGPCTVWAHKGLLASDPQTVEVRANGTARVELGASAGTLVQVVVPNARGAFAAHLTDARKVVHMWADMRDPELRALGEPPAGARRIGPLPPGTYTLAVQEREGGRKSEQTVALKGEPFLEIQVTLE